MDQRLLDDLLEWLRIPSISTGGGLRCTTIVGLPEKEVREARDRVRAALHLLARSGRGAYRDAESTLDQLASAPGTVPATFWPSATGGSPGPLPVPTTARLSKYQEPKNISC